jgi:predicted AlkP superfamily phosphohydrolase/phosphomutase
MTVRLDKKKGSARIETSGQTIDLKVGNFSDWIKIKFKTGMGMKIRAICRFYISSLEPDFEMYVTPLNIDPEKPALPISHPFIYSVYLSKLLGDFTTLGEADDTWALNEGIISEDSFIKLAYDNHLESEAMLFNAMDKTKRGLVACWFQTTDSIQHMFFRYLDKKHPSLKCGETKKSARVIEELYLNMDDLVGRVMKKLRKDSVLVVMSDHGFKNFCRGVNLNSWLYLNGYLHLKDGRKTSGEWFKDVDWSKTKAYGLGLGGIYINQKGREAQGIVAPGRETLELKKELADKLNGLKDDQKKETAINILFDKDDIPAGPYKNNCPDFIVGYNEGYRVSWDSVTGMVDSTVFVDNTKAWSGDHCIDSRLVPGIFLSNVSINTKNPHIIDLAPTALKLFGLTPPRHMDGRALIADNLFGKKLEKTEKGKNNGSS